MAIELAHAYVSIIPSTRDLERDLKKAFADASRTATITPQIDTKRVKGAGQQAANAFGSAFSSGLGQGRVTGFFAKLKREAQTSGNAAGFLAGKAMGAGITAGLTAATAGLTAVVGGIGVTLFKGFERYKSLDATAKRLGAMGKTVEQVKSIVADINEVVEGTPIALDAAAKSATQFLQGGVKEGEELKDVLTAIADASGASGTAFDDLAIIFGQVMNKGKLQAEEMLQLNERGIGIQAALRKEFGWTGEELEKLSKDGKISFEQLIQAVEGSFGGMAKRAGDTIDGALSNMQAAVGRVGANFLSAIFGDPLDTTQGPGGMVQSINKVTGKLDELNQWVIANKDEIKQFFTDAANTAKDVANAVKEIGSWIVENKNLALGFAAAFVGWKSIAGVVGLLEMLGRIDNLLGVGLPGSAKKGASGISVALAGVTAPGWIIALLTGGGLAIANEFSKLPAFNNPTQNYPYSPSPTVTGRELDINTPVGQNPLLDDARRRAGLLPGQAPTPLGPSVPATQGASEGGRQPGLNRQQEDLAALWGNPTDANTGGALMPATSAIEGYLRNQLGFTGTIGGWRAPDGYNEHSSGKALDVMIGSASEGYALLPNMLNRPGVEYVIWDNKMWYPSGASAPYTGPNPHTDHLHVKTFNTGGAANGPGGIDRIPAWLTAGEHVLDKGDVSAMGGQSAVYAFRDALHRNTGGPIEWMDFIRQGSSGGGPNPNKGGWGGNIGKRIWAGINPDPIWGDKPTGIAPGEFHKPAGPWQDHGQIAPWWYWPGEFKDADQRGGIYGTDPLGPDWQKRRDIVGDKPWNPRYNPDAKIPTGPFNPEPGAQWPVSPPERGLRWAFNEGGAVTPDMLLQLMAQGVDPNTLQHGQGQGQPPGPTNEQLDAMLSGRTEGYTPASAGNIESVGGGGVFGDLINLGASAVNNLIDQAASAASAAGSAAANAFAPGSGAAASVAIQMGAQAAKRGVQWAADMANIGIGAASEIFFPFGAPRWLNDVSPMSFMPQQGIMPAAVTSGEKALQDTINQQQGIAHGTTNGAPPGPEIPQVGQSAGQGIPGQTPPVQPPSPATDPVGWFKTLLPYDTGGILKPRTMGVNLSSRPEYVFTQSQWDAIRSGGSSRGATYNVYAQDVDAALRGLRKQERRNSRQYGGRP